MTTHSSQDPAHRAALPGAARCLRLPTRRLPPGVAAAALLLVLAGCQARPQPAALSLESRLRLAGTLDAERGGQAAATVAVLQEAAAQQPRDGALQERLSVVAERAGAYDEALQAARSVIALQGPSLPRLLVLGRLELQHGQAAAAAEAYQQASVLAPGDAMALGGLGLARDMAGDHAAAQAAYRSALVRAPQDWSIRSNLALSLVLSQQPHDAVASLAEAEYAPGVPRRARHNLALALAASGRRDRVLRVLRLDMGPAEAAAMAQELAAVGDQINASAVPQALALRRPTTAQQPAARRPDAPGPGGLSGVVGFPAR